MGPPSNKRVRGEAKGCTTICQPEDGIYALVVRSDTGQKLVRLELSEPQPGEECCIVMEPIAEHRVEWLPDPGGPQPGAIQGREALTKATLPCGHGFHALALLYHFAKNEMTCPCCRQGHGREQMAWSSIPAHVRPPMEARLARVLMEEREEQVESDAQAVARLLEREVNVMHFDFMPPQPDRQVLILFAYTAMDSLVPPLVQEIGLSVTGDEEALHFSSSGSSVQELNRNLRVLPVNVRAFELVVATRMVFYGVLSLARSRRFELPPDGGALEVPCAEPAGLSMQVQARGVTEFGAVRLRLPRQRLQSLVQQMEVDTATNPHVVQSQLLLIVARGDTSDEG
jgi:hypothetical protein